MKVGILLPRSSTLPLIAHNFMAGLNNCVNEYGYAEKITLFTGKVGFGTDKNLIYAEAEKLILEHNCHVLVAFIDHPSVECLLPLMASLNKLLIIVNNGAKYPASWKPEANVIYHTLNNTLCCRLTGEYAAKDTKEAILASSYYDGGYSLCHAFSDSLNGHGGSIVYNFVGPFQRKEFTAAPLIDFLNTNPEVNSLLTVLSGDLVPEYLEQLKAAKRALHIYASPAMLDEDLLKQYGTENPYQVQGFVPWISSGQSQNKRFIDRFQQETGREADVFAALGWDTALILLEIEKNASGHKYKAISVIAGIAANNLDGAKGEMHLHKESQQYLSPVYRVQAAADYHLEIKETINLEQVIETHKQMTEQEISGMSSGWVNTYLCS